MPSNIKIQHAEAKRAKARRRPVERMPPNIKAQHRASKVSKRLKINRKPSNREVFNLLMNNPFLDKKERDSMIRTHCGLLMPRKISF
jgi:hypothetical protein